VLDGNGKRVGVQSTYANRTVVITGLDLTAGASYKLVVLTSVQDVGGRSVPAEYGLILLGPAQAPLPSPEPAGACHTGIKTPPRQDRNGAMQQPGKAYCFDRR